MPFIEYTVTASAKNDEVARLYHDWIEHELEGKSDLFAAVPRHTLMEPPEGGQRPRVETRMVFEDEKTFRKYRDDIAPAMRESLAEKAASWTTPGTPSPTPATQPSSIAVVPASSGVPLAAGAAPTAALVPAASTAPDEPITLHRRVVFLPKLGRRAWTIPLLFGALIVFGLIVASVAVAPLWDRMWTACKTGEWCMASLHGLSVAWVVSYLGMLGMGGLLALASEDALHHSLERYLRPGAGRRPIKWVCAFVAPLVAGALAPIAWALFGVDHLVGPRVVYSFISNPGFVRAGAMELAMVFGLFVVGGSTTLLALACSGLLFQQRADDSQPVPVTVYARLRSARSLLLAGSAVMVLGAVQASLLVRMGLLVVADVSSEATAFATTYAAAWGGLYSAILIGLYVPTVGTLQGWGHRFVLANAAEKTPSQLVAELSEFDNGSKAEFKPVLSLLAALAPLGAGIATTALSHLLN